MAVRDLKGIVVSLFVGSCASVSSPLPPDDNSGALPQIQAVQPPAGPTTGGQAITVVGQNFPKDSVLKINGVVASDIIVVSDTQITATLPESSGTVGKVAVSVSVSDGRSTSRSDVFAYYYGVVSFPAQPAVSTGNGPRAVALRDLNHDGKIDLVTANGGESSFSLFFGTSGGAFAPETKLMTSAPLSALAVGDIDGDTKPDLVAISDSANQLFTLLSGGGGTLPFIPTNPVAVGQSPIDVALEDA